jgi:hypothetical protein
MVNRCNGTISSDQLRAESMIKVARAAALLLFGILIGCGGGAPSTSNPGPPPPHGGNLIALPGAKGYVEIVKKEVPSGKAPLTAEVSFYFLKGDGTTPASPAPSVGTLRVGNKDVALKAAGDGLVTPSGPPLFANGDVDGVLSVELDGKPMKIPLGVR